jgi:hypothetical protein
MSVGSKHRQYAHFFLQTMQPLVRTFSSVLLPQEKSSSLTAAQHYTEIYLHYTYPNRTETVTAPILQKTVTRRGLPVLPEATSNRATTLANLRTRLYLGMRREVGNRAVKLRSLPAAFLT